MDKPILVVELDGPNGNSMVILASAQRAWRKHYGTSNRDFQPIFDDAISADRDHLMRVLAKHFHLVRPVKKYELLLPEDIPSQENDGTNLDGSFTITL